MYRADALSLVIPEEKTASFPLTPTQSGGHITRGNVAISVVSEEKAADSNETSIVAPVLPATSAAQAGNNPVALSDIPPAITRAQPIYASDSNAISRVYAAVQEALQPSKDIIKLAIPLMCSYDFSMMLIAVGIIVGQHSLDSTDLAATSVITSVVGLLAGVVLSLLFSVNMWTGRKTGELTRAIKDHGQDSLEAIMLRNEISQVYRRGLIISFPSLLLACIGMLVVAPLLTLLGQDPVVMDRVDVFMKWSIPLIVCLWIRQCAEAILLSFKEKYSLMAMGLSSFLLSTSFAYFLSIKLNLQGVAIAYDMGAFLTCLGFCTYLAFHKNYKDFHFFRLFNKIEQAEFKKMWELAKLGLPTAIAFVNEFAISFILTIMAGLLGNNQLAAMDFALLINYIAYIPVFALSLTSLQLISSARGEHQYNAASRLAREGLIISMLVMMVLCLPLFICPETVAKLVKHDIQDDLLPLIHKLLPIQGFSILMDTMRYNMLQTYRALDSNLLGTVISIVGLWIALPLAGLLSFMESNDIYGIAIAYCVASFACNIAMGIKWYGKTSPNSIESLEHVDRHMSATMAQMVPVQSDTELTRLVYSPALVISTSHSHSSESGPLNIVVNNPIARMIDVASSIPRPASSPGVEPTENDSLVPPSVLYPSYSPAEASAEPVGYHSLSTPSASRHGSLFAENRGRVPQAFTAGAVRWLTHRDGTPAFIEAQFLSPVRSDALERRGLNNNSYTI